MKRYIYLFLGLCSLGVAIWAFSLMLDRITTSIFIGASLTIILFGIFSYRFFGIFFASIFGKKIKGTIIKQTKREVTIENGVVDKYATQYAFINKYNKLVLGEASKKFDCGFVPIKALGKFKYVDSPQNCNLYENALVQKIDKKAVAKNEFVPPENLEQKKKGKRAFIIMLIISTILFIISLIF